jgi:hypothetical protein
VAKVNLLAELERIAGELDRHASDLQLLRRQVFSLVMALKKADHDHETGIGRMLGDIP